MQVNTLLTHTLSPSAPVTSMEMMNNFTGDAPFSGVLEYVSKQFMFTKGYMETYSVACGIGQIPTISTSSSIYGQFGTGSLTVPVDNYPSQINIPSYSSMELKLETFNTNRLLNFD